MKPFILFEKLVQTLLQRDLAPLHRFFPWQNLIQFNQRSNFHEYFPRSRKRAELHDHFASTPTIAYLYL